jgi:multidrug efflux pump
MAGLTPMMLGISLDFANGGYSVDSPTALWWKQLATAVVFGLGVATILTLLLTPALLALRIWIEKGAYRGALGLRWLFSKRDSAARRDRALEKKLTGIREAELIWDTGTLPTRPVTALPDLEPELPLRAAE